jgi:hypothetical protein
VRQTKGETRKIATEIKRERERRKDRDGTTKKEKK